MSTVAEWIGYAVMTGAAVAAVGWLWGLAVTKVSSACIENKMFYDILLRYAKEKRMEKKRVAGLDP